MWKVLREGRGVGRWYERGGGREEKRVVGGGRKGMVSGKRVVK